MPFIVFLAITPVGLLILLISQKIPMVQQWFLSDFATTNFLWIDLIITLACCFISLQFNKLFMKEIWLKTNLMEIDFLDDYQNFIIKPLLLHLNQNINIRPLAWLDLLSQLKVIDACNEAKTKMKPLSSIAIPFSQNPKTLQNTNHPLINHSLFGQSPIIQLFYDSQRL